MSTCDVESDKWAEQRITEDIERVGTSSEKVAYVM